MTARAEKIKSVHDHHQKKIFWGTFLASKKNFPGQWCIQNPYENPENHMRHRNLSSVAPIFFGKEKFCTGAGRCMLSFSQQRCDRDIFYTDFSPPGSGAISPHSGKQKPGEKGKHPLQRIQIGYTPTVTKGVMQRHAS